ncbi:unnamed protein product, partial [Phaeothamnion confervicola]
SRNCGFGSCGGGGRGGADGSSGGGGGLRPCAALALVESFYLRRLFAPGRFVSVEAAAAAVAKALPARGGGAGRWWALSGGDAARDTLDLRDQVLSGMRRRGCDAIAALQSAAAALAAADVSKPTAPASSAAPVTGISRRAVRAAATADAAAALEAISDQWRAFLSLCRAETASAEDEPAGLAPLRPAGSGSASGGIGGGGGSAEWRGLGAPLVVRSGGVTLPLLACGRSVVGPGVGGTVASSVPAVLSEAAATAGAALNLSSLDPLLHYAVEARCSGAAGSAPGGGGGGGGGGRHLSSWLEERLGMEARTAARGTDAASAVASKAALAAARVLGGSAWPEAALEALLTQLSPATLRAAPGVYAPLTGDGAPIDKAETGGGGARHPKADEVGAFLTSWAAATAVAAEVAARLHDRYEAVRDVAQLLQLVLAVPAASSAMGAEAAAAVRRASPRLAVMLAWYSTLLTVSGQLTAPGTPPMPERCATTLLLTGPPEAMPSAAAAALQRDSGGGGSAGGTGGGTGGSKGGSGARESKPEAGRPLLASLLRAHGDALATYIEACVPELGKLVSTSGIGRRRLGGAAAAFLFALCDPGIRSGGGFGGSSGGGGVGFAGGNGSALEAWLRAMGQWRTLRRLTAASVSWADGAAAAASPLRSTLAPVPRAGFGAGTAAAAAAAAASRAIAATVRRARMEVMAECCLAEGAARAAAGA